MNIQWDIIDRLIIEDLSDIKSGNKWGKKNQHWCVGYAQEKIKHLSEENDVRLTRVNAAHTSQMCSVCVGSNTRIIAKASSFCV